MLRHINAIDNNVNCNIGWHAASSYCTSDTIIQRDIAAEHYSPLSITILHEALLQQSERPSK